MHIAYLVQQFLPEIGAGPARVAEMASRWLTAGARVTVITGMPNRPEGRIRPEYRGRFFLEEDCDGIRVLRSWLYASPKHGFARTLMNNGTFMASAALHTLARLGRADVLIASAPPFFPHLSGWLTARLRRVPLVLEMRDLWPDYLVDMGVIRRGGAAARGLFALERFLVRNARGSVVVTESFRRRVIAKGAAPETVSVIPNGVDLDRYYAANGEPAPLPGMERTNGRRVVGYLGNMGAGQALSSIIRAAEKLRFEGAPVRFVLAGDGPERRAIERLSRELHLDNVAIHGPILKDRTRAFYNACDLCLVPLADVPVFQETVPSKLFEVMACERPALASVGGEASSIVEESGGGLVARPGDSASIAAGIRRLLSLSPEERAVMGRRGRRYVAEHYDRSSLAERYWNVLQHLMAEASRPPTSGGLARSASTHAVR